ncbi:MAG: glycerophosphodiester phosphodiesterase [Candidatus Sumerlaeia bacterium]
MTPVALNAAREAAFRAGRPEIIAHRGASGEAPENTMSAVRLAWRRGADAVEVDVHLSRDGRLVVMHDETTARTAGVNRPIAAQSWDELRRLDAGAWMGAEWAGEPIPLLDDVLETIPSGRRLIVEIKCGPEAAEVLERAVGLAARPACEIAFISFSLDVCRRVKQMLPAHEVSLLSSFRRSTPAGAWTPRIDALIETALAAGLDGLDLKYIGPLDQVWARRIREAGLRLIVYTVDDPAEARRLAATGVEGITTNIPALLRRLTWTPQSPER